MRYKLFGKSGLRVSELCLGTMTFGQEVTWGSTKEESQQVFETFCEAGGNFLDTANYYTKGTSETYIGEWMVGRRSKFVLGTKYSLTMDPTNPNAQGNHRKNMVESLESSLKRLKTDYIDILWVHAWDMLTPIEETMRALDDMVQAGKILYIGASDFPAWVVARGNAIAELRGWSTFAGLQLEYSLIEKTIERDQLQMAQMSDLAITAWSPLGMGLLTGKYHDGISDQTRFSKNDFWQENYLTEKNHQIVTEVIKIAKELDRKPTQVALNWLRQKPAAVIPIVGAKNGQQLKENLQCLEFNLAPDQIQRLDEVSRIDLGFPQAFLQREGLQKILYGDFVKAIDTMRTTPW